jgi:hypothetical protein
MRFIFTLSWIVFTLTVYAQQADSLDIPSNSYESNYRISRPTLIYSYDEVAQIHNYSTNWDFDKDGIKDELYFVGTGGAHVYYFLKVILSSDKKSREFNFIQSDVPFLAATDTSNIEKIGWGFIVADMGKNQTPTIIVRLDASSYNAFEKELTNYNIKTRMISIDFENGRTNYGSL